MSVAGNLMAEMNGEKSADKPISSEVRLRNEDRINRVKILDMIAKDMKNDARDFDGRPFNGRTVAQYFGNQGAAISALAKIIKAMQQEIDDESNALRHGPSGGDACNG